MRHKKILLLVICSLFVFATLSPALAEEISGKITAVANEGREITVESEGGEEVELEISGSRTKITQGGKTIKRDALKEDMKVKVTYEESEAKQITVE